MWSLWVLRADCTFKIMMPLAFRFAFAGIDYREETPCRSLVAYFHL
jgi:hypothetical protein